MEQHPVPQNILDVEFKLFGSFSMSQFLKIIGGCGVALVVFVLPIQPMVLKLPLMLIPIAVGVLMAIIKDFGKWFNGFLKALFISPRYVWVKESETPQALARNAKKEIVNNQNVSNMKARGKVDINDLPLEQIFQSSSKLPTSSTKDEKDLETDENFGDIYKDVFGDTKPQTQKAKVQTQPAQQNEPAGNTKPTAPAKALPKTESEIGAYLNNLKTELSKVAGKDKKKEAEILAQINQVYANFKKQNPQNTQNETTQTEVLQDIKGQEIVLEGQIVFGITVDKSDKVIAQAVVNFTNLATGQNYQSISDASGKFSTGKQIPNGEYEVSISHPNYRFHTYKIRVAKEKLPAYKFRTR